ncbi:uncharacterized protein LOC117282510 [Cryptotermes secundus]|uniref:uncharacterized protein LOC117282510 n=1 Tax=Cryptotermes secundus TaxID=105785 RepID=UPI001454D680|nr:uncharacterized protein LOC117282510 [Cryptotermes secundus]
MAVMKPKPCFYTVQRFVRMIGSTSLPYGPKCSCTNTTCCKWCLENSPHLERSFQDNDPVVGPTENLEFLANVTNDFILGLYILHTYAASVDQWRHQWSGGTCIMRGNGDGC